MERFLICIRDEKKKVYTYDKVLGEPFSFNGLELCVFQSFFQTEYFICADVATGRVLGNVKACDMNCAKAKMQNYFQVISDSAKGAGMSFLHHVMRIIAENVSADIAKGYYISDVFFRKFSEACEKRGCYYIYERFFKRFS